MKTMGKVDAADLMLIHPLDHPNCDKTVEYTQPYIQTYTYMYTYICIDMRGTNMTTTVPTDAELGRNTGLIR